MHTIESLKNTLPQLGLVQWLGVREARNKPIQSNKEVLCSPEQGILGDRYAGRSKKRQVTLIQQEHLAVVAALLRIPLLDPARLRRNIVVSGINLLALRDQRITIGTAELRVTGYCHPCSKMEDELGAGGYNALRGHGGLTAQVLIGGQIRLGDTLRMISPTAR